MVASTGQILRCSWKDSCPLLALLSLWQMRGSPVQSRSKMNEDNKDQEQDSWRENLAWGLEAGIFFAAVTVVLAIIPALIRALVGTHVWWQKGLSFLAIIGLYLFGGITGGVIVGLLRPWTRYWWGRRMVGALAAVPFAAVIIVTFFGVRDFSVGIVLFTSAVWGGAMSFIFEGEAKP